jgi:acylpyruvate hydrolase
MRFASVLHEGQPLLVALVDGVAFPVRGATELGSRTPLSFLTGAELDRTTSLDPGSLTYRPLVPQPGKIICVGLNYAAHVAESGREETDYPALFTKFSGSLTGPHADIPCPPESQAIDYEGELAVVIGERVRRVGPESALEYVAGVTVANDVSMRDFQNFTSQWLPGKAWEASTPVGPELVTLDEAGDLGRLELQTHVNGQLVQQASTGLMIRDVATLISTISVFITLEPGDLILTGTPSGVGFRREPPLLMKPGDVVTVEIAGVGRTENRFVAG